MRLSMQDARTSLPASAVHPEATFAQLMAQADTEQRRAQQSLERVRPGCLFLRAQAAVLMLAVNVRSCLGSVRRWGRRTS